MIRFFLIVFVFDVVLGQNGLNQGNLTSSSSCTCALNYSPACGSDGITYPNGCALACSAQSKLGLLELCKGTCPCTTTLPPVQSIKFPLLSQLSPFNLDSPTCRCTRNVNPVCGADGETYANECLLECVHTQDPNIVKLFNGECSSPS